MDYQLVIIDRPIEVWNNSHVKELFPKIVDLKKRCFHSFFKTSYIVADTFDFLATHMVVCNKVNGELNPLLSFKIISDDTVGYYHQQSPLKHCVATSPLHKKTLENWVNKKNYTTAYLSTFAVDPSLGGKTKYDVIKFAFDAICAYNKDRSIDQLVTIAATFTKANSVFRKVGFSPLNDETGNVLPYLYVPSHDVNTELMVMEKEAQKDTTEAVFKKGFWLNRIEVNSTYREESLKIAS